jgi:hypothetical protein
MFDHLKKLDVTSSAEAWIEIPEVSPGARLRVRQANAYNRFYSHAQVSWPTRTVPQNEGLLEKLDRHRDMDRILFAKHVVVGWEGVLDKDNQPVEATPEAIKEFCQKLPDWLFDRVMQFCREVRNFIEVPDAAEVAGN